LLTIVNHDETPFGAIYEDADARLISAAPDLLEALEGLCGLAELRPGHLHEYKNAVDAARAAIAKATGTDHA
jgi:hypothetical protein